MLEQDCQTIFSPRLRISTRPARGSPYASIRTAWHKPPLSRTPLVRPSPVLGCPPSGTAGTRARRPARPCPRRRRRSGTSATVRAAPPLRWLLLGGGTVACTHHSKRRFMELPKHDRQLQTCAETSHTQLEGRGLRRVGLILSGALHLLEGRLPRGDLRSSPGGCQKLGD